MSPATTTPSGIRLTVMSSGRRVISGRPIVFDSMSSDLGGFVEVMRPSSVDRTVHEKLDVRAFVNHDPRLVLGRLSAGTLRLAVDRRGLTAEIDMPTTTYANDLTESIERGDIRGWSYAFQVLRDEWTLVDGIVVRDVEDARISEVSPCTMPAYLATESSRVAGGTERRVVSDDRVRDGGEGDDAAWSQQCARLVPATVHALARAHGAEWQHTRILTFEPNAQRNGSPKPVLRVRTAPRATPGSRRAGGRLSERWARQHAVERLIAAPRRGSGLARHALRRELWSAEVAAAGGSVAACRRLLRAKQALWRIPGGGR
jgi:uncharacterized protein